MSLIVATVRLRFGWLVRFYELALLLGLVALLGALVHQRGTVYLNVASVDGFGHVVFYCDCRPDGFIRLGDHLPLYRFNPFWKVEIGVVTVDSLSAAAGGVSRVSASYDAASFSWPVGRQGSVLGSSGPGLVRVDLPAASGVSVGERLNLFDGRRLVGGLLVESVSGVGSVGRIQWFTGRSLASGLVASQFVVPTMAVVFRVGLFSVFEGLLIAVALGWWLCSIWRGVYVFAFLRPVFDLVGSVDLSVLARLSGVLVFGPIDLPLSARVKGGLNWLLHFIVACAFGWTLYGFLLADLFAVAGVFRSGLPLSFLGVFSAVRWSLWSVTIVGCFWGYGYSILSPLWGVPVGNVDFSVAGWVSNALCYPLLGFVLVRVFPSFVGSEPIFSAGLWAWFVALAELLLNVLYTSSIWNLGRKFGVMCDKGLCDSGFYAVVRHPSYSLEALMLLCMEVNGFSTGANWFGALCVIALPYWLRAEREDRFMRVSNPDYGGYAERVRFKYLPGVL